MVRVATYDPGRLRDRFAMLGAVVTRADIQILNAKEWYRKDFTKAADEIATINKEHRFDYHICETNNQGVAVIDIMKRYHHIPVLGVTTTKTLTDPVKIRLGQSMAKNTTVEWVEWARNEGIIKFPKAWSPGIRELNRQTTRFVGKHAGSSFKYEAADDDDHDDLVLTLLILCHFARRRILGLQSSGLIHGINRATANEEKSQLEKTMDKIKSNLSNKGFTITGTQVSIRRK